MRILVINGSPRGEYSVTLQTALFLERRFPRCAFEYLQAGQRIKALEKDMTQAVLAIERADLLLFCYGVYTFLAPSQLCRFIELMKAENLDLRNKYAAQLTTSKHFYDVTAHEYIKQNCQDLGLRYITGLSADMDDLLEERGRTDAEQFWRLTLWSAEHGIYAAPPKGVPMTLELPPPYEPSLPKTNKDGRFRAVIVTNCQKDDANLRNMIEDFRGAYPHETRVVNIGEYPFKGGCLGCFSCAATGKCVYTDGFDEFLRNEIQSAAAIIYAFTVRDHFMGSDFKVYDDRQFCNGHRTVTMGMPVGYIAAGRYGQEANLRMVLEARSQVGGNYLCGVATDEQDAAGELQKLSDTLCYALERGLTQPPNFYGVGGMKIFRDLIYLMRGMMKADHKFYKEHGFYDFPQKQKGTALKMKLVGSLASAPGLKKKLGNKMNEGMIAPYKKVLSQYR